ncbi:MAG: NCS2 family permease [Candidatus Omnitrophica bacterium]|nr:NCS2 family permease [Candidatus Omnitrophota bacterium]
MAKGWVKRDLDGFFGLFLDNLIQLMLIVTLCRGALHFPDSLVLGVILPGAAVSILFGNFLYTLQARRLARRTGRDDVTALPYGINTVSLFGYIFFVMLPVYRASLDPMLAWRVGLIACLGSAIIEIGGAFVCDRIRRVTPRAALLSALAGIAITFISMEFVFRIFEKPALALIPLGILLIQYCSKARLPLGLPGGLAAVLTGTVLGLLLRQMGMLQEISFAQGAGLQKITWTLAELAAGLRQGHLLEYLSIIIPMGLFNVIGSLQNLESAEAAGDRYPTRSSLLINGAGSLLAACLGSCFPTTIYIGHPGWKALGARSGYSLANGLAIAAICFTGMMGSVFRWVPFEAGIGILLWIGVIIMAQAFQETPKAHALAVAVGLFPALAAWGLSLVEAALRAAGSSLSGLGLAAFGSHLGIRGMIALERGFIFTSMFWAAWAAELIDRNFRKAAGWMLALSAASWVGLIHAHRLTPGGLVSDFRWGASPPFALAYLGVALLCWGMARGERRKTLRG